MQQCPLDLSFLPTNPGIYIFKDSREAVLYIGKAINLRSRVRSYWSQICWRDRPKLAVLVPQIFDVEIITTKNEKEALILEASLIYQHQPKYNVLLKDDREFPWLALTYGEPFPRLIAVRDLRWVKRKYPKAKLFGPYTDSGAMYRTLEVARQLFPLRKRATPLFRDRTCLNYHLGKCLGPCQGLVETAEYDLLLREVQLFLEGKHAELASLLLQQMEKASEELLFERAAKLRDQYKVIKLSEQEQSIVTADPDCQRDIIGWALDEESLALQIFRMRDGKLVSRESYLAERTELQTIAETIFEALKQAYLLRQEGDLPPEILLQELTKGEESIQEAQIEGQPLKEALESLLASLSSRKVRVLFPQRGEKKEQIELAEFNALQQLDTKQKQRAKKLIALSLLREALGLEIEPTSIDCFDISHLQGTNVVASCVRFENALPNKNKYRRFKLRVQQNNDYESIQEIVYRRYQQSREEKVVDLPQLVVIDGGLGQLHAAEMALEKLGVLGQLELISLAKKEEEVYRRDGKKLILPKNSPALQLLQRIRDEAHRFALTYNRLRRTKTMKSSFIDDINGIGARLKERISTAFTMPELMRAPPQELDGKLGIGAKRADRLWQAIREKMLAEGLTEAQF